MSTPLTLHVVFARDVTHTLQALYINGKFSLMEDLDDQDPTLEKFFEVLESIPGATSARLVDFDLSHPDHHWSWPETCPLATPEPPLRDTGDCTVNELRKAGYAVRLWSPEEVAIIRSLEGPWG